MVNDFFNGTLNTQFHLRFARRMMILVNITGLLLYAAMHCILFDFPFDAVEELAMVGKLLGVCSLFALGISGLLLLADTAEYLVRNKSAFTLQMPLKLTAAAALLLIIVLASCNVKPVSVGVKKDFNTGLSSSYNGMEPAKTFLVMNNEVLGHTDIPLGESFLVVNDGVKGLEVKNGKVKVGCSLRLIDAKGHVLLSEKDLFEGRDEFEEKDATMLKCTVNTGKPMEWEENYKVAVTFWDKNGTGKIDNEVTIRAIDMP